jgi:uncharacterized protein with PIN domain
MKARQCDSCKALFTEEELKDQLYKVIHYTDVRAYGKQRSIDLCPSCYNKLLQLIEGNKE